jgi:hypothetical protein
VQLGAERILPAGRGKYLHRHGHLATLKESPLATAHAITPLFTRSTLSITAGSRIRGPLNELDVVIHDHPRLTQAVQHGGKEVVPVAPPVPREELNAHPHVPGRVQSPLAQPAAGASIE